MAGSDASSASARVAFSASRITEPLSCSAVMSQSRGCTGTLCVATYSSSRTWQRCSGSALSVSRGTGSGADCIAISPPSSRASVVRTRASRLFSYAVRARNLDSGQETDRDSPGAFGQQSSAVFVEELRSFASVAFLADSMRLVRSVIDISTPSPNPSSGLMGSAGGGGKPRKVACSGYVLQAMRPAASRDSPVLSALRGGGRASNRWASSSPR